MNTSPPQGQRSVASFNTTSEPNFTQYRTVLSTREQSRRTVPNTREQSSTMSGLSVAPSSNVLRQRANSFPFRTRVTWPHWATSVRDQSCNYWGMLKITGDTPPKPTHFTTTVPSPWLSSPSQWSSPSVFSASNYNKTCS